MKRMKKIVLSIILAILTPLPAQAAELETLGDPFQWLEEVQGAKAIEWARAQNQRALGVLTGDSHYASIEQQVRQVVFAKDRIPLPGIDYDDYVFSPGLLGGYVYNFWQDDQHVKGVWRRATIDEYKKSAPAWEVLLDVDELAKREKENWVWKAANCLGPEYRYCMVSLSHGGKDANVKREFDLKKKNFVKNGFELPESKATYSWVDKNTLLVSDDFEPTHQTASGYPRLLKLWRRGQLLKKATEVFAGENNDVEVHGKVYDNLSGRMILLSRSKSFFETEVWILDPKTLLKKRLNKPDDADVVGVFQNLALLALKTDWKWGATETIKAGTLVGMSMAGGAVDEAIAPWVIMSPSPRLAIVTDAREGILTTKNRVILKVLDNVRGRLWDLRPLAGFKPDPHTQGRGFSGAGKPGAGWEATELALPGMGNIHLEFGHDESEDRFFASYEDFITPKTLYLVNPSASGNNGSLVPEPVKKAPSLFDTGDLVVEQFETKSRDRTVIPYFLVHKKSMKLDGSNPTLLWGYGGFEIPVLPSYSGVLGKVWLEKGGIYALANIRGGGEFGPAWHLSALKENRQRAYDDFIAVAESLIKGRVTSAAHLGIRGRSNGGLLMGVMLTERPDLFSAIACQVPLLDMLRYTELPPGASWIAEYGDPKDPSQRKAISRYSPYQNLKANQRYPEVFFFTSTTDDRVHPGHARKMAAKMESLHKPFLYYENMEGGHGGAADLEQTVKVEALTYSYLYQKLSRQ